jgi:hypothetical protein
MPRPFAGTQSFTTTWGATDPTSLTHLCTASGRLHGERIAGGERLAGADGAVGLSDNPSSCTWTVSGAGGSATYMETMITFVGCQL